MEDVVKVTCGQIVGKLHKKYFTCPGIHQECIELDNNLMITPKMMFIMGGKEKLKDWKNALRLNGIIFRKLMDSGELEFYNHAEQCTGKCISRHGGVSRYDTSRFETLYSQNVVVPMVNMVSNLGSEYAYTVLREVTGESSSSPTPCSTSSKSHGEPSSSSSPVSQTLVIKQECDQSPFDSQNSGSNEVTISGMLKVTQTNGSLQELCIQPLDETPQEGPSNNSILAILQQGTKDTVLEGLPQNFEYLYSGLEDHTWPCQIISGQYTLSKEEIWGSHFLIYRASMGCGLHGTSFWQGILNVGLIDVFFREIKTSLDCLKNDLIRTRGGEKEAEKIANIVQELGMETKLRWKLAAHKAETEKQKQHLLVEIDALKKRVAESEERQQALKRKSDTFSQLMVGPAPKKSSHSTVKEEHLEL